MKVNMIHATFSYDNDAMILLEDFCLMRFSVIQFKTLIRLKQGSSKIILRPIFAPYLAVCLVILA